MERDYYEEVRKDFAELFASMDRAQLEEAALRLAADAKRFREDSDKLRGVIR